MNTVKDITALRNEPNALQKIVEEVFTQMPFQDRMIYLLKEFMKLDDNEIACLMDLTKQKVIQLFDQASNTIQEAISHCYTVTELFDFNLIYCDAMVKRVMDAINNIS